MLFYGYNDKNWVKENIIMTEKKMSLNDLVKQRLEAKKGNQANNKGALKGSTETKQMKSQMTKKVSNQTRKMGV